MPGLRTPLCAEKRYGAEVKPFSYYILEKRAVDIQIFFVLRAQPWMAGTSQKHSCGCALFVFSLLYEPASGNRRYSCIEITYYRDHSRDHSRETRHERSRKGKSWSYVAQR